MKSEEYDFIAIDAIIGFVLRMHVSTSARMNLYLLIMGEVIANGFLLSVTFVKMLIVKNLQTWMLSQKVTYEGSYLKIRNTGFLPKM